MSLLFPSSSFLSLSIRNLYSELCEYMTFQFGTRFRIHLILNQSIILFHSIPFFSISFLSIPFYAIPFNCLISTLFFPLSQSFNLSRTFPCLHFSPIHSEDQFLLHFMKLYLLVTLNGYLLLCRLLYFHAYSRLLLLLHKLDVTICIHLLQYV